MNAQTITAGSRTIEISHANKILFPEREITKSDLLAYYRRIADKMLPFLKERPLTMERYPDGIEEEGFYQKEAPEYFPDWIQRADIPVITEDKQQPQVICNDLATLLYLVNQGCVTFHPWLSRVDQLHHPDKMIFDLDPPNHSFDPVRFAAQNLKDLLEEQDLVPYLMTTGSRGLHVIVPLDRTQDFDTVRDFAKDLSDRLAEQYPDQLTTEMNKEERGNRLFLDYLRNSYGQNSIAPYTVRPLPGAPVATPLRWDELSNPDLHSQRYTTANIFRRLGQIQDPWKKLIGNQRKDDQH